MCTQRLQRQRAGLVVALWPLLLAGLTSGVAGSPDAFPPAEPESQGLSSGALAELVETVRGYFADDQIVGAELLVIKNRRTVLHEAIGWRDRETETPMERDTLFNIRSMTKPVTGTVAQLLTDMGRLKLDDAVYTYLPAFDNDKCRAMTVRHLITHRSGLPLILPMHGHRTHATLEKMANLAAESGPEFPPGTSFQYSDAGSEVLGAVIEQAGGARLDELVQRRILDPLGMRDTVTLVRDGDARVARISSAYIGGRGQWERYWYPGNEPFYKFALGSQSLYATPMDYARFLALWMDGGRVGEETLLSRTAVERALTPVSETSLPTGFPGLKVRYGQMWMLYVPDDTDGSTRPVVFGHGGSDGTHAWVWPEHDLMVLYFTQSRGNLTGISLERELDRLLIHPERERGDPPSPSGLEACVGTYLPPGEEGRYAVFAVRIDGGRLLVEVPQGIALELEPPGEDGIWRTPLMPQGGFSFEYDAAGTATAMWIHEAVAMRRGDPGDEEAPESLRPYVGTYSFTGGLMQRREYVLRARDGQLAYEDPEGHTGTLEPPDGQGRWNLHDRPREYATFTHGRDGTVTGLAYHAAARLPRGELPPERKLTREEAQKYLGTYLDLQSRTPVDVVFRNGRLAVKLPRVGAPLELYPPDEYGRWHLRAQPALGLRFVSDHAGRVISYRALTPEGEVERPRLTSALPCPEAARVPRPCEADIVLTIVYDNNAEVDGLTKDWGFACLLKGAEKTILFDTGGQGEILLENMRGLKLDVRDIDVVVLSHAHMDHVGGLTMLLEERGPVPVYIPHGFPPDLKNRIRASGAEIVECAEPTVVCAGVRTTGTLDEGEIEEQALCVQTAEGWLVVVGCAHPGIHRIVERARELTDAAPHLVVGGFHLPEAPASKIRAVAVRYLVDRAFNRLEELGVKRVAPCHCSGDLARELCRRRFGERCELVGVGHVFVFASGKQDGTPHERAE